MCACVCMSVYVCVRERVHECVCVSLYQYVTIYGKTPHMGFFVKVEFDVSMISSTIELTRVQILDFCCGDTALCDCATPSIIEKLWFKGIAMHAYGVSAYYA